MIKQTFKQTTIAIGTSFLLAISVGVSASTTQNVESVRVAINDININTALGQEKLYKRISQAARNVCGSTIRLDVSSLKQLMKNRTCIKAATSAAMSDSSTAVAGR